VGENIAGEVTTFLLQKNLFSNPHTVVVEYSRNMLTQGIANYRPIRRKHSTAEKENFS